MNGRAWTTGELSAVRERYPDTPTVDLARALGRTASQVYQAAARMGVVKSAAYLASPAACRLRRGTNPGIATRFKKGQIPHNKGLRRPGWAVGRMRETQFRKGERRGAANSNWRAIGTVLPDSEGYLRIKVREHLPGEHSGFGNTKVWPLLHRHVWEEVNGPIPAGHTVVFKGGGRGDCSIENLELISRAELMRRNTIHVRYPKEMVDTMMLLGAVKRRLRERDAKEHND